VGLGQSCGAELDEWQMQRAGMEMLQMLQMQGKKIAAGFKCALEMQMLARSLLFPISSLSLTIVS